jgi:putative transposase
MTRIEVRYHGRSMGQAVPHRIRRHAHPRARPELAPPPAAPTGIDYLKLIEDRHAAELASRLRYASLPGPAGAQDSEQAEPAAQPEGGEQA